LNLAYALRDGGFFDEALETLGKALKKFPDNKYMHLHLAELYKSKGMDNLAKLHFQQASS
jgi:Tfp pilus assembly protein PilF